ncbi:MAG: hypothetical protein AAF960_01055 [Bacteroidota bacterium]
MAIWQYKFYVFPKENYADYAENFKKLWHSEYFDEGILWKTNKVEIDFFDEVNNLLKKGKSWSKDLIIYGKVESDCFEILCENGYVISVSFRINYTNNYDYLLSSLIDFFIQNGLILLDEQLELLPLNFLSIKSVIENAPQVEKYRILSRQSDKKIDDTN